MGRRQSERQGRSARWRVQESSTSTIDGTDQHQYPLSFIRSLPKTPDVMTIDAGIHLVENMPDKPLEGDVTSDAGSGITKFSWVAINAHSNLWKLTADKAPVHTIRSGDLTIDWKCRHSRQPGRGHDHHHDQSPVYHRGTWVRL